MYFFLLLTTRTSIYVHTYTYLYYIENKPKYQKVRKIQQNANRKIDITDDKNKCLRN